MTGILERLRPLGFTPLASRARGEVLKYNFRGVGPVVLDKSGHGNLGRLKPIKDPPRRRIRSLLPPEVVINFDGKNDYIKVPNSSSLNPEHVTVELQLKPATDWDGDEISRVIYKRNQYVIEEHSRKGPWHFAVRMSDGHWVDVRATGHPLSKGDSHHIRGTFDGEQARLYLNGSEINSTPYAGTLNVTNNALGLGADPTTLKYYFNGSMNKVRIAEVK